MSYSSFAILGGLGGDTPVSAGIGSHIARALLQKKVSVKILTRPDSAGKKTAKDLQAAGAILQTIDYSSQADLEASFKDIDVVISALPGHIPQVQENAIRAAKQAQVKLFLPSEFGGPRYKRVPATSGFAGKQASVDLLKSEKVPFLVINNGPFAEFMPKLISPTGDNKLVIVGKGDTPISITAIEDVAAYVAHVLTSLPPTTLANKEFKIEGCARTANELAELIRKRDPNVEISHSPVEEADRRWKEEQDFIAFLKASFEHGEQRCGPETDNDLFPGHQFKAVEPYFA